MTRVDCISIDNPIEWEKALEGIKHSFAHTREHNYAMHLSSGLPTYLFRYEKDDIRIVCPIAERNYYSFTDIVTPFGISGFAGNGPCQEFTSIWRKFALEKGYICGYIVIHPIFVDSSYFEEGDLYKYNNLFIFDLRLSDEQLFANLSENRRRQVRHWEKDLDKICLEKPILVDFFLSNFYDFHRRRNAPSSYLLSKEALSFLVNQDNVFMVGIMEKRKIVAVAVFLHTLHMGDYLFNISIPGGEKYSVTLIWYGLKKCKSMGIPYLNIGGGGSSRDNDTDSLVEFKRRFGADIYPLRALKQVYNPNVYKELCKNTGVDPDDKTGYFPPYHMPL